MTIDGSMARAVEDHVEEGEVVLVPAFLQEVVGQQERLLEEAEWSCVEARHRQNYLVNLPMTMTSCDSPPAF